jgi:hypothetical protein
MMTDLEYHGTQQGLLLVAGMVRQWDFAGFLERIGTAHAAGPVIDPTLYRAAGEKLSAIEDLARAAATFKKASDEFHAKAEAWS